MNRNWIIICCVALGIALFPLPYSYYQILRFLICGTSLYLISLNSEKNKKQDYILILIAIAYNPIFKIHFDKSFWSIINILTILYFFMITRKYK